MMEILPMCVCSRTHVCIFIHTDIKLKKNKAVFHLPSFLSVEPPVPPSRLSAMGRESLQKDGVAVVTAFCSLQA